jgi:hypothetical protein
MISLLMFGETRVAPPSRRLLKFSPGGCAVHHKKARLDSLGKADAAQAPLQFRAVARFWIEIIRLARR